MLNLKKIKENKRMHKAIQNKKNHYLCHMSFILFNCWLFSNDG